MPTPKVATTGHEKALNQKRLARMVTYNTCSLCRMLYTWKCHRSTSPKMEFEIFCSSTCAERARQGEPLTFKKGA